MSRRILVVDDDHAMVRTISDILRLRGWNPDGAYSGEEAVLAEQRQDYEMVLMDIRMPGIDGVTAFRRMKEHNPEVRVLLMTAHTEPEMVQMAIKEGAVKVISKPIDLPSLLTLLQ